MKRVVKLTEQDLYRIVKRVIAEQEEQASAQPSNNWPTKISPVINNEGLKNKYASLDGLQTGKQMIEKLLPDGSNAKKMFLAKADEEAKQGVAGLSTNFFKMMRTFLEYTWKGKVDLTKYDNKIFGFGLKNDPTYQLLLSKESPVKMSTADWDGILNFLRQYQKDFRVS
jgi:hypothetical protein